jgi:hypothetical protein
MTARANPTHSRRRAGIALAVLVALAVAACGEDGNPDSEDFGNILNSPAGLVVVEEEHPSGWGRPDCFLCHEIRNMHVVNRTGLPDCDDVDPDLETCLDLGEIQSIIRNGGEQSCGLCHGDNGVEP